MKTMIFLVIVGNLGPFNGPGGKIDAIKIQQMPGILACRDIAENIREMSKKRVQVRCVAAHKDYE